MTDPTPTATPADLARLLETTPARSRQRCCFLLRVRPQRLTRTGWRRFSLFPRPEDGRVVGYVESDDVAAAMAAMEREEVNARWQAEMAQYFIQPDGGRAAVLPQYFHLA